MREKIIDTGTDLICIKDWYMWWTNQHVFTEGKIYTIVWWIKSKNTKHIILNIVNNLNEIHYVHFNKINEYFRIFEKIND